MHFTILGSGGSLRIPRACCYCKICEEAREKGFPYKRLGQSLFLHDEQILFDTPEDINEELNIHRITEVKSIFYSHWHPDHTLGCRIVEVIASKRNFTPSTDAVYIYMPENRIEHLLNGSNPIFSFYENLGYCRVVTINEPRVFNSIIISPIKLLNNYSFAFLIEEKGKRVLYCPCHSASIPLIPELYNLDLIIMGLGYMMQTGKGITNFEGDNMRLIKELRPKKVVFTHIEEVNQLSYDDYKAIEQEHKNILFAYDGMKINI